MQLFDVTLNAERNVTLTAYIQSVGGEFSNIQRRPAIIVMPGGAYEFCSEREADPVASVYIRAGFQVFILRYSVGEHKLWRNPLDDYDQAYDFICSKADDWFVDSGKIAVIGFSAGAHLAGCAATVSSRKPVAAILGYPVLTGKTAGHFNSNAPDVTEAVDENTCPCFIFSSRTDDVVPIFNSTRMLSALEKHNVPFECHIYSFGPHGFSVADSTVNTKKLDMSSRIPNWVEDSIDWLKETVGDF